MKIDRTTNIHENAYYEIGNYSVASSFFFSSTKDIDKFKSKINQHFDGLCQVVCYGFLHEEFRIIVLINSREEVEAYCRKNYPKVIEREGFIPHTAYIFAKAMADLQSGYVKWFNFKFNRIGGLTAGRYFRHLIVDKDELKQRIKEINKMTQCFLKTLAWRYRSRLGFRLNSIGNGKGWNSGEHYKNGSALGSKIKMFQLVNFNNVQGHFNNLPPKRIIWSSEAEKYKNLIGFILLKGK